MNCEEAERLLSDLLAGELEAGEAEALQGHLAGCAACRDRAAALSRQHRALAELAAEETSRGILERIRTRLADEPSAVPAAKRPHKPWRWSLRTSRPAFFPALAAAGALAVMLILVAFLVSRSPGREARETPDSRSAETIPAPEPKPHIPPTPPPPEPRPKEEPPRDADLRRKAEEELAPIRDRFKTAKEPVRTEDPPPPPEPPRPATKAALAAVERVEGTVLAGGAEAARAGQGLLPGEGLRTSGPASLAVLAFPDGTRLELRGETVVSEIGHDRGKKVVLERGDLRADVTRQPAGEPMVFHTPQGTATVLGTSLHIVADAGSTRLEVTEGKVRLARRSDGKSVDVAKGYAATAADLAVKALVPDTPPAAQLHQTGKVVIKFGPRDARLPEGVLVDSGEEYDARRGYGWKGPIQRVPGASFKGEPVGGRNPAGPFPGARDPMTASQLAVGWSNHKETWSMPVANGRYLVTVCVGDPGDFIQGPHHVWIEGLQLIHAFVTKPRAFLERKDVPVEVKDGELTMTVGGGGTTADESSDTILCYLIVRRAPP